MRVLPGQYLPGTSGVHRLDARTKILATLAYAALVLWAHRPAALCSCLGFTVAGLLWGRPPLAALWRGIRPLLFLIALTAVLDFPLVPGPILWRWGPLVVTAPGVRAGLLTGARLGLLILQSTLLTATTAPLDLAAATERLLAPFSRVGVPAHEIGLMAGIALRFIPVLADEAGRITTAQAARGAELGPGSVGWARAVRALGVPLLLSVLRRADELALAMECRGYRGGVGRTRWRASRAGPADAVVAAVLLGLAVTVGALSW